MANQTLGYSASLVWNGVTVAGLTKISGLKYHVEAIDGTTHQSPSAHKEYFPGLVDVGDVNVEGFFDYADSPGQLAMVSDMKARIVRAAKITFPASLAAEWPFTGFIIDCEPASFSVDGLIPFTATIKVTGVATLGLTASTGLTTPFFSMNNSAVISPAPSGSVYDYVATVLTGITSIIVTPTASAGVITVNGNVVASGVAASAITLGSAGSITIITIVVTETNKIPKTYIIRVDRP
jgi:hypothetical protein